jgi:hypothetical protein
LGIYALLIFCQSFERASIISSASNHHAQAQGSGSVAHGTLNAPITKYEDTDYYESSLASLDEQDGPFLPPPGADGNDGGLPRVQRAFDGPASYGAGLLL